MEQLTQRDIQTLMGAIREIYSETDIEALPDRIASAASKIIPSATTCFCKITQTNGAIDDIEMISHGSKWESPDTFKRYIHEHPFINLLYSGKIKSHPFNESIERAILKRLPDFKRSPENTALKISDVLTDRQFRSLKLFNEFFRPNGIKYMLGVTISFRQNFHTGLSFYRDRKDFTEKERLILNLLSPHIGQAYRNAKTAGLIRKHESFGLTQRESEVLHWVSQGKTNSEISIILNNSINTVKKHLDRIYQKLGVENRVAAARLVIEKEL